jgi:hypothetical protein
MAIKIPSRNIYEKDNDKIRDNKIDRIEVGAFEIKPDNDYETTVYNEDILTIQNIETEEQINDNSDIGSVSEEQGGEFPGRYYAVVLIDNKNTYVEGSFQIPKVKDNHYISRLYYEENEKKEIAISIHSIKTAQSSRVSYIIPEYNNGQQAPYFSQKTYGDNISQEEQMGFIDLPFVIEENHKGANAKVESLKDNSSITVTYNEEEDKYFVNYKILSRVDISYFKGNGYRSWLEELNIPCTGEKITYIADKIELTFYGNTIGIDLQDKTIYVPNQEGSKPFSVEGNELIQVSNYTKAPTSEIITTTGVSSSRLDFTASANDQLMPSQITILFWNNDIIGNNIKVELNDGVETPEIYEFASVGREITIFREPYQLDFEKTIITVSYPKRMEMDMIQYNFSKTQAHYAKGKETATIRCSISDYYDENGEKVIATNNSNKMAFDIYDEVIPYSYGADGSDKPLSRHKDGSPKTFVVLGTRIFYDGAVWQELTLQEK